MAMLEEGDIVFQQSQSPQSVAIREATGSSWTHVGVVVTERGATRIVEAGNNGVALTSVAAFVNASRDNRMVVMRLKSAEEHFTPEGRETFRSALKRDYGKRYDRLFEWSDVRIYCSQLVWRAYEASFNLSIGEVQRVEDLNFNRPAVQALINERYGLSRAELTRSSLLQEKIITPLAIKESNLLETVFDGVVTD